MFKHLALRTALAVALVAGPAFAGTERLPLTGSPALEIDVPTGWTVNRDSDGNLLVLAADRSGVIVCSIIPDAGNDLDADAASTLAIAKATPYARTEPAAIGGAGGKAYYSTTINDKGAVVQIRLVLARADATHIIAESELSLADATAAQIQALYALASNARIVH